jgi:eukaryotic-like serine/threonine-protein kinase
MSVQKIGRYEISGELGKGAMGVVYKATDPTIGRTVALKTMRMDLHAEKHDEMLRRFQHEARAAGALNHPNIVTIYDAAEADGLFYIAMECIEGTTLASVLHKRKALSAQEVVDIGGQICAGLQYAHFRKVVHRDIKPQNIMLAAGGLVKIMDFGIAKAGASLTHTGEVLGTPHYMSPEQVKGQDLDGRSDIFSLGVVLYEMVTGEKPFSGQNVTSVIYKIVNEQPMAPRELDVSIHPGLSMIVSKCLAKDAEDRYQEASDLATALKSYKIVSIPQAEPAHMPPPKPIAKAVVAPPIGVTQPLHSIPATKPIGLKPTAVAAKLALEKEHPTNSMPAVKTPEPVQVRNTLLVFLVLAMVLAAAAIGFREFRPYLMPEQGAGQASPTGQVPIATTTKPVVQNQGVGQTSAPSIATTVEKPSAVVPTDQAPPNTVAGIGDLRITSNPPGAQVTIDGATQDYYVTPFNTPPLKPGTHTIAAAFPALPMQSKQVEVTARKRTIVDFQLTGDKTIYNISSAPSGADILIDGTPVGAKTPAQVAVPAGSHKVGLRLDGFDPLEVTAQGAAGETLNLSQRLRAHNSVDISEQTPTETQSLGSFARARQANELSQAAAVGKGAVIVRTRPRGVTIVVDGYSLPRGTPFRFPVKAGSHTVVLQKEGFQTVTRVIQVEEGKISHIDERMQPN